MRLADDLPALRAIAAELPEDTVALRERAADVYARIARELAAHAGTARTPAGRWWNGALEMLRFRAKPEPSPGLADSMNNVSVQLFALGRLEEALAASEKAVAAYRTLAATRPEALPNFAASLSNLSNRLSALGRREAALAASEEAVAIDRVLAAALPDAFRPKLAASLNNLSIHLFHLGRQEAALAASEEAVVAYRTLAAVRPDAFRHDFAKSLNDLSNILAALGRREAAVAAIEEAVAAYRTLTGPFGAPYSDSYLQRCVRLGWEPGQRVLVPGLARLRESHAGVEKGRA